MHFEVQVPLLGRASQCCYDRLVLCLLFGKTGSQGFTEMRIEGLSKIFCYNWMPLYFAPDKIGLRRAKISSCSLFTFIWLFGTALYQRRTLPELNFYGTYPSSEREIAFRRCSFTYSIKREIRHFHVVVVQKRVKKCTNERDARAELLFWL